MLKSNDILFAEGGNDECYTPEYGVEPILKYLPKNKTIWCPFDTIHSHFVQKLLGGGGTLYIAIFLLGKIFLTMSLRVGISW